MEAVSLPFLASGLEAAGSAITGAGSAGAGLSATLPAMAETAAMGGLPAAASPASAFPTLGTVASYVPLFNTGLRLGQIAGLGHQDAPPPKVDLPTPPPITRPPAVQAPKPTALTLMDLIRNRYGR